LIIIGFRQNHQEKELANVFFQLAIDVEVPAELEKTHALSLDAKIFSSSLY